MSLRRLQRLIAVLALYAASDMSSHVSAQNEVLGVVVQNQFEIDEKQFDAFVFENLRTAAAARKRLDTLLDLRTNDVDRTCRLSEIQRRKLQLAGRGDIKNFFEQVEAVRQKFLLVRKDQNKFNELWQEIQPLQTTLKAGLHGEDSLFYKTLRNALDPQQLSRYLQVDGERKAYQYRAKVELVVAMLEANLPLRDEQRQKLILLILENTRPPRRFGNADYYVVLWNVSQVPKDKLRPLFEDTEWRILSQQLDQARGMEHWLKQNGALDKPEPEE